MEGLGLAISFRDLAMRDERCGAWSRVGQQLTIAFWWGLPFEIFRIEVSRIRPQQRRPRPPPHSSPDLVLTIHDSEF